MSTSVDGKSLLEETQKLSRLFIGVAVTQASFGAGGRIINTDIKTPIRIVGKRPP
jgi:hypothetical protein